MVSFFHEIVRFFNEEKLPYMLTGSMAMGVYTVPRSTQDFDFVVHLLPVHVNKLAQHFKEGYYCDAEVIQESLRFQSMFNIIEHATMFKADFIPLKRDAFAQLQFQRRRFVEIFDTMAYVISGEDLILSKLIWIQQLYSGRQIEDIKAVARNPELDWIYIKDCIRQLKLNTFDIF